MNFKRSLKPRKFMQNFVHLYISLQKIQHSLRFSEYPGVNRDWLKTSVSEQWLSACGLFPQFKCPINSKVQLFFIMSHFQNHYHRKKHSFLFRKLLPRLYCKVSVTNNSIQHILHNVALSKTILMKSKEK